MSERGECAADLVVVQFEKRAFPRGLKPRQFTALIGAAEAAPFQGECKLHPFKASANCTLSKRVQTAPLPPSSTRGGRRDGCAHGAGGDAAIDQQCLSGNVAAGVGCAGGGLRGA